jgi:hypothetical protein
VSLRFPLHFSLFPSQDILTLDAYSESILWSVVEENHEIEDSGTTCVFKIQQLYGCAHHMGPAISFLQKGTYSTVATFFDRPGTISSKSTTIFEGNFILQDAKEYCMINKECMGFYGDKRSGPYEMQTYVFKSQDLNEQGRNPRTENTHFTSL